MSTRIPSSSAHHSYLTKLHMLQCGGRWEVVNTPPNAQVFTILPKGRKVSPFGTRGLPLLNIYRLRRTRFLLLWCDGWSCGGTLTDGRARIELGRGADILSAGVFSTFRPLLLWTNEPRITLWYRLDLDHPRRNFNDTTSPLCLHLSETMSGVCRDGGSLQRVGTQSPIRGTE